MTDLKLASILLEVGFVLCLISMILGPLDIMDESILTAMAATVLALAGLYYAFKSWQQEDESLFQAIPRKKESSNDMSDENTAL